MEATQSEAIKAQDVARTPTWLRFFFLLVTAGYAFLFIRQPNPFFADDSFFYLQVGRNFALGHGSTFNGLMPTNGYHPLWMLLCAAVYRVFPDRIVGFHVVAALIVVLNVVALVFVGHLLRHLRAPEWIAWTLLIPFLFGLQLGTESSLSAALLAATLLALYGFREHPGWKTGWAFNLLAALAVLARLDSIFVIAALWIALLVSCLHRRKTQIAGTSAIRIHLTFIPLYAVLWGTYLASNWIWFHTLMPISGLLKSHNAHDHALGRNLPHTAWLLLAICAVSLLVLWFRQRDRWLRFVELPFFLGILAHAAYIVLRMTGETRWTWYYVSWAVLAALTASRAAASLLRPALPRPAHDRSEHDGLSPASGLRATGIALVVLISLALWYKMGWRHSREAVAEQGTLPAMREAIASGNTHRVLAYDQPGGMAYFTRLSVVPLDGLMADREFQSELSRRGIADFIRKDHIDAFAGPTVPFDAWGKRTYCDQLFLESTKYTCEPWTKGPDGEPRWMITGVEVYSRLPLGPAGYIALPPSNIVWTGKNYVTLWRITPGDSVPEVNDSARSPAAPSMDMDRLVHGISP